METNNKLREALSAALEQVNKVYDILSRPCVVIEEARQGCREARGVLIPALAEPLKNCEMGTAEEQARRYAQYCDAHLRDDGSKPCTNCPCCGKIPFGKCEFAWAQMPYEEGGAK